MAFLTIPHDESELKKIPVAQMRKDYVKLAKTYNKIVDGEFVYCHNCDQFKSKAGFYEDNRFKSGYFYFCKDCVKQMVENRKTDRDEPNETKESSMDMFRLMDLPYVDSLYEKAKKDVDDDTGERTISSPFIRVLRQVKTLPQWQGKTYKHSEFPIGDSQFSSNRKPKKETIIRFGSGFTDEEYLYLQDQYEDWCARTQVDSKSQETYIVRICFKLLDIWKAQRVGRDTTTLDKSLNELMNAANLQPKQNIANASTDTLTFGQLIEKWEQEEPIPEPEDEFKDPDKIGHYIRAWFKGGLAAALGINNAYSQEYYDELKKYTVEKPDSNGESDNTDIYNKLFGSDGE